MATKRITDGWDKYQKLVLFRLNTLTQDTANLNKKIDAVDQKVDKIHTSVTILKVKVGLIGAAAGGIVAGLASLFGG